MNTPAPDDRAAIVAALAALTPDQVETAQHWYAHELHEDARADTLGEEHRDHYELGDELAAHVRLYALADELGDASVWAEVEQARRRDRRALPEALALRDLVDAITRRAEAGMDQDAAELLTIGRRFTGQLPRDWLVDLLVKVDPADVEQARGWLRALTTTARPRHHVTVWMTMALVEKADQDGPAVWAEVEQARAVQKPQSRPVPTLPDDLIPF